MVCQQVSDFLENGNIRCLVNLPDIHLPRTVHFHLAVSNEIIPGMVSQITAILADNNINIVNMLNKSRGDNDQVLPELLAQLISIKGVLSVRGIVYLTNHDQDNQGHKSRKSWLVQEWPS